MLREKTNLSFEGVLRAQWAGAHVETIGNVCSFAQAKCGPKLCLERLNRDQTAAVDYACLKKGPFRQYLNKQLKHIIQTIPEKHFEQSRIVGLGSKARRF